MSDFFSSALIGLTYGNLWVCALLVFSLQTTKKLTSVGFLIGRSIGIFILGIIISIAAKFLHIPYWILQCLSGCILFFYSCYCVDKHILTKKNSKQNKFPCSTNPAHHDCSNCMLKNNNHYQEYCKSCNDDDCFYEKSEFKSIKTANKEGFLFGFTFGLLRGGVLCSKLLLLAPILSKCNLVKSLLLTIVFIISSSIYPILGLFVGKFALQFVKYKKSLIYIGIFGLFVVSVMYLSQGLLIYVSNID